MKVWHRRAMVAVVLAGGGLGAGSGRANELAPVPGPPAAPTDGVRIAPSSDGHVGAWLVAGPFDHALSPAEEPSAPRLDDAVAVDRAPDAGPTPRWRIGASNDGAVDIGAAIENKAYAYAYAAGVLHVEEAGRYLLLLGGGDGLTLAVDGRRVYSRDDPRPEADDQDIVPIDLAAGDHVVLAGLHRRGFAHALRMRVVDASGQPPRGAAWLLPGTTADDARALAARMSAVTLDRGMDADGYRATLTVKYLGGAPRGAHEDVKAKLIRSVPFDGAPPPLYEVRAGDLPIDDRAARDLVVRLPRVAPEEVEDDDWTVHVEVAGRTIDCPFHPRHAVRAATARADKALRAVRATPTPAPAPAPAPAPRYAAWSLDSVEHLRARLVDYASRGDGDMSAEVEDARELDGLAAALEAQRDPYVGRPWRKGAMRRAYRSPADGHMSEFAVYVPPDFDPARTYPLIVALHGMNGRPLEMIMWLFGFDDPDRDGNWEDRHPRRDLPPLEAIVVAPDGHFNTMYRELGEDDVMRVVDWATATYPIDPARVTITGPSMGGIGSAGCALHHPDRFAAAEPLCGYHSYLIRGDIGQRAMRPWERFVAEERSNVLWAENGMYLPLYIVHGTKDLPEENSGVLIDRYTELNYDVTHEHPDLGHNVWQTTYEDLKGADWLLTHRRPMHPRVVRFKTPSTRWADDAWVHVRELAAPAGWGEVDARVDKGNAIAATTHGIAALGLDRDTVRVDDGAPVSVAVDGRRFVFEAGEPIELHKEGSEWRAGRAVHDSLFKHDAVTGPIKDVFHEPVLFVWGASDPAQASTNEEVARAWARVHAGVKVEYPVMSDAEFLARGEPVAGDRALFLVGNAASNRVVRELEPSLPIRIAGGEILVGDQHYASRDGDLSVSQLGAAFIRPNPRRPDRYVVIVEGVGPLGTWRSLSLPDMLPDYVVYDQDVAPATGQLILGAGKVRAGGTFGNDWSVPPHSDTNAIPAPPPAVPRAPALEAAAGQN
ncbi:MAG TPA: alpha/beta hydrolase-fold protein [Polyangiaceae bacterium]|jgi:predicted esterase|nr:alpha/beta hydrolase-fold protein [Polyangiaceae bacterium]